MKTRRESTSSVSYDFCECMYIKLIQNTLVWFIWPECFLCFHVYVLMWCSFAVNLLTLSRNKLSSGSHKVPLTEKRTVDVIYPCHDFVGGGGALHCFCPRTPKTLVTPLLLPSGPPIASHLAVNLAFNLSRENNATHTRCLRTRHAGTHLHSVSRTI